MLQPAPQAGPATSHADLLETLEQTWQTIGEHYDAVADLPDTRVLLAGADLAAPEQAAETVIANMLLEVMGSIPRFSPWHTRPLGLRLIRGDEAGRTRWALAPHSMAQWRQLVEPLARAIRENIGLVLAADVLEGLEDETLPADRVMAACQCVPPRLIRVRRAALQSADIVCDVCRELFRALEPPQADD